MFSLEEPQSHLRLIRIRLDANKIWSLLCYGQDIDVVSEWTQDVWKYNALWFQA